MWKWKIILLKTKVNDYGMKTEVKFKDNHSSNSNSNAFSKVKWLEKYIIQAFSRVHRWIHVKLKNTAKTNGRSEKGQQLGAYTSNMDFSFQAHARSNSSLTGSSWSVRWS